MQTIKNFFARVAALFASPKAKAAFREAEDMTAKALPFITIGAQILAGITPTTLDDAALAYIKSKYPELFDGSITDGDRLRLFVLGAVTDLMKQKYPGLATSVARVAIESAYLGSKA